MNCIFTSAMLWKENIGNGYVLLVSMLLLSRGKQRTLSVGLMLFSLFHILQLYEMCE